MKTLAKSKIIGKIRQKTTQTATGNPGRGQKGSTIVAVMAALVFIGIVVAGMLKNTGSQSTVSRGYGSALEMSSTTASGVVATEAFMQSAVPAYKDIALAKLQGIVDFNGGKTTDQAKKQPFVFGGDTGRRELAGSKLFFRSQILNFNADTKRAMFEIESAKNKNGKSMNKMRAFYLVDVKIDGKPMWAGLNAMLLNMEMEYAHGNIHVKGHSTFMEKFSIGASTGTFTFEVDDKTHEGSVFFYKQAKLEKDLNFKAPTFFNDNAIINQAVTFYDNVGFNKHISTESRQTPMDVYKSVWVREGFKTVDYASGNLVASTNLYAKFNGVNTTRVSDLYYTDKFPLLIQPGNRYEDSPCKNEGYIEWQCLQVKLNEFTNIRYDASTHQSNFSTAEILDSLGLSAEAAAARNNPANPGSAAAHYRVDDEPDLSPANITNKGKSFLTLDLLLPGRVGTDNGVANITLAEVNGWYTKYPETQYPEYYSEGHLLVKVNGNINFANPTTSTFNNKIAFVVDNGGQISGKYFNSSIAANSNASTLIYVGETGRLSDFGTEGDFRGLIYVDEKNNTPNSQNTFKWGADSHVDGAVILKGKGRINWTGGQVTITKNDDVLAGYSDFITIKNGQATQGKIVTISPGKDRVGLTPLGYYFGFK